MISRSWQLREGTPADVASVLFLERSIVEAPHWARQDYEAIFMSAPYVSRRLFVATEEERLLGYSVGSVTTVGQDIRADLESVVVSTNFQRQGIGRALCGATLDWCRQQGATRAGLEVRSLSTPARQLYESIGFEVRAKRKAYYAQPSDDALILEVDLR